MTRTLVPDDWNRTERWSSTFFAQARSVCKAHARFRNAGYQRKIDKKKVGPPPTRRDSHRTLAAQLSPQRRPRWLRQSDNAWGCAGGQGWQGHQGR